MKHSRSFSVIKAVLLRPRAIVVGALVLVSVLSVLPNPVEIPMPTQEAVDYQHLSDLVWGSNKILTLLLLIGFLVIGSGTPISNKIRKHGKYLTFIIFASVFFVLNWLVQLPLERIRVSARNQIENQPDTPVMQWVFSQFLESLPIMVFSILAVLFVCWLINKSPRKWWLWASGIFSFLFLAFLVLEPFTISHKAFGQTPVEVKISELAQQIGISKDSIVLEDCEPFDKCEIARVSGLGPTRLILLNKELPDTYPESWTIQSFAHESKHFVKDDNLVGWFVGTFILLFLFWFADRICRAVIGRFSGQLGFTSLGQPAALPLIILILNALFLIALPPVNLFRQHVEFEADRYGLELTHENKALAEMAASWSAESKLRMPTPSLFFMLFRSSHPSDATRITFASEYRLEDNNQ